MQKACKKNEGPDDLLMATKSHTEVAVHSADLAVTARVGPTTSALSFQRCPSRQSFSPGRRRGGGGEERIGLCCIIEMLARASTVCHQFVGAHGRSRFSEKGFSGLHEYFAGNHPLVWWVVVES